MIIHHLRNATFIIESKNRFILIDPMLSNKGELPAFSYFKHKMQKNPIVDLPENSSDILIKLSPNKVIANHLEALNHCPLKRETLKNELKKYNLLDKVFIPNDGESITVNK